MLVSSEYQECEAFFIWAESHAQYRGLLTKICNEGKRAVTYGSKLKRIGLRKGFPDFIYPKANDKYHCLFIEMKTVDEKTKRQKPEQIKMLEFLNKHGNYATFAFGWQHAAEILTEYTNNAI